MTTDHPIHDHGDPNSGIFSCDFFDETSQSCEPPHNQGNLMQPAYTVEYCLVCSCSSGGRSFDQNVLGTSNTPLSEIILSPNPFKDHVNIDLFLDYESELQIEIFNTLGKKVGLSNHSSIQGQISSIINTSDLTPGVYYFVINDDKNKISRKLMMTEQ